MAHRTNQIGNHFTLEYHRIVVNIIGQKGFAVRKRNPNHIERDY